MEYPEGTKRVFTKVSVRKLDIVDKGANLQFLVYKKEDPMAKETKDKKLEETKELPEIVETDAVKSVETEKSDGAKLEVQIETESGEEIKEVEKAEKTPSGMTDSDLSSLAEKIVNLQKSQDEAKAAEEVKKSKDASSIAELIKAAVEKAISPLSEKVDALDEARGESSAVESEDAELEKKAGGVFQNLFTHR